MGNAELTEAKFPQLKKFSILSQGEAASIEAISRATKRKFEVAMECEKFELY